MQDPTGPLEVHHTQPTTNRMDDTPQHSQKQERVAPQSLEKPQFTKAELQQLLAEWNTTQAAYPGEQCIPQLFETQVERTPEAIALVFDEQELTYRELNTRANQLAHYLRAKGVGPEVLVGICMERSFELIIGLLAILKAGGAYVPLDLMYPQERLAFMIQDSQIKILLTQQHLLTQLSPHTDCVICIDSTWPTIKQGYDTNPNNALTSENLAYVIYTSGSTGRPKGVEIVHRSVIAFIYWAMSVFTSEDLAGMLASTSLCFDLSVFEIFVPLSCGGSVILVENALHLPYLALDRGVTMLNTVPSAAAELVRMHGIPASVRTINLAGEPLHGTLVQQLYQQHTIKRVYNLYGPTEDTTYSTYTLVKKGEQKPSIGRPISNTQVYILDSNLQPVPPGIAGELYIGGDGLARGYLKRPDLTAERFVPDPFSQKPGARLYKTGDLAHYLPDGTIAFLGRIDHQVKIRGFRVELGEIEATLYQHPAIQTVVVIAREDTPGEKRLVAYLVPRQGQDATTQELQDHLLKTLPAYMVPSAFVWLKALPLTPNGKIDRPALPRPDSLRPIGEEAFLAPTTTAHQQLQQIWEDLLDVRPIGIRDNFFYLGGHSLLAIRLIEHIEQAFGKKLSLATLFAGPTIEQLARALQTEEERILRTPLVAVQEGGSKRPFFYLHGAWNSDAFYCFKLAHQLGPEQPFYALAPYNFADLQTIPTVEEMAAAHIQAIRTVQPEGPYFLGGFCNGGLVAYEMARQLEAQGQKVDLLVLIEPAFLPTLHALAFGLINRISKLLRLTQEHKLEGFLRLRHIYKYIRRERKEENLDAFRRIDPDIFTLMPTFEALRQDDHALLDWIITGYHYDPYPGKIVVIWPQEEHFYGVWQRKVSQEPDRELQIVPGAHISCRTKYIKSLADTLQRCLENAQAVESECENGEHIAI